MKQTNTATGKQRPVTRAVFSVTAFRSVMIHYRNQITAIIDKNEIWRETVSPFSKWKALFKY